MSIPERFFLQKKIKCDKGLAVLSPLSRFDCKGSFSVFLVDQKELGKRKEKSRRRRRKLWKSEVGGGKEEQVGGTFAKFRTEKALLVHFLDFVG